MSSAYGSNGGLQIARVQYRLAIHYDAAALQISYWRSGVAVATLQRTGLRELSIR